MQVVITYADIHNHDYSSASDCPLVHVMLKALGIKQADEISITKGLLVNSWCFPPNHIVLDGKPIFRYNPVEWNRGLYDRLKKDGTDFKQLTLTLIPVTDASNDNN